MRASIPRPSGAVLTALLLAAVLPALAQSPAPGTGGVPRSGAQPSAGASDSSGDGATPGRNSFTEGQARARIQAMGYSDVGSLSKTEEGFWTGPAMKNGTPVTVRLDYQGDVVEAR
jgi:hypothetical protein